MKTVDTYFLQPKGGFHFGELGLEQESSQVSFPSDSLFGALVMTISEAEGGQAAEQFIAAFQQDPPPFRFTSLFPAVGSLPLLPLPFVRICPHPRPELPRKFGKKVGFVSPAIFERLACGKPMGDYLDDGKNGKGLFLQDGHIWATRSEHCLLPSAWTTVRKSDRAQVDPAAKLRAQSIFTRQIIPRVRIGRVSGDSMIYHIMRLVFNDNCGLWLGVEFNDETKRAQFEKALHMLGDSGIGAERSSGYGGFSVTKSDTPLIFNTKGDRRLLLSRYIPAAAEIGTLQHNDASYQLANVGGWHFSPRMKPLRRKSIALVEAGSVLASADGSAPSGTLVDVTPAWNQPAHKIWRYGKALSIPIQ